MGRERRRRGGGGGAMTIVHVKGDKYFVNNTSSKKKPHLVALAVLGPSQTRNSFPHFSFPTGHFPEENPEHRRTKDVPVLTVFVS